MVQLVACGSDERYLAAASASGQPVHPFHHPRFLRVAAAVTGRRLVPLVVRRGSTDVGVATWLEHRVGPVASVNRVPFPYAGPLVPADLLGETLDALWRRGRWRGVAVQTHQFPPDAAVGTDVVHRGSLDHRQDQTYVVDTGSSPEEIDRAYDARVRRQVRRALATGVTVSHVEDAGPAASALDAALDSVFAHVAEPSGYRSPLGMAPAELRGGGLEVSWLVAHLEGASVGCLLSLAYRDRAVAWLGGVLHEHRSTYANVLLYTRALEWAHDVGAQSLDLAGNPTPAIASFKKKFGGALVDYPVVTHRPRGAQVLLGAARGGIRRGTPPLDGAATG